MCVLCVGIWNLLKAIQRQSAPQKERPAQDLKGAAGPGASFPQASSASVFSYGETCSRRPGTSLCTDQATHEMLDHSVMWRAWLSQHVLPPLTVAIDIRLPEQLPATIKTLCESLSCGERVLRAVLAVLRAQCLVLLEGDRCSLTATGAAFLLRRSGAFSGPFLMSSAACAPLHDRCKAALLAPDDSAQPTRTTEAWASGSLGSDEHRAQATLIFMHALHAPNAVRAAHTLLGVLRRWCVPWSADAAGRRLRLLDAGGGSGVYAVCLAKGCAELEVDIGELPEVAAAAEAMGYVPPSVAERVRTAVSLVNLTLRLSLSLS